MRPGELTFWNENKESALKNFHVILLVIHHYRFNTLRPRQIAAVLQTIDIQLTNSIGSDNVLVPNKQRYNLAL